nr:rhodanese-like domain-containing protein [Streptomyces smaragdinus]
MSAPATSPDENAAHYAARSAFEADVSDVHADLASGAPGIVVLDTRSGDAWDQGHIPGALRLPTARIADMAPRLVDPAKTVVTYCWGPGCNGATRAALPFARLTYWAKKVLVGCERSARKGFAYDPASGFEQHPVDELTTPRTGISSAC